MEAHEATGRRELENSAHALGNGEVRAQRQSHRDGRPRRAGKKKMVSGQFSMLSAGRVPVLPGVVSAAKHMGNSLKRSGYLDVIWALARKVGAAHQPLPNAHPPPHSCQTHGTPTANPSGRHPRGACTDGGRGHFRNGPARAASELPRQRHVRGR